LRANRKRANRKRANRKRAANEEGAVSSQVELIPSDVSNEPDQIAQVSQDSVLEPLAVFESEAVAVQPIELFEPTEPAATQQVAKQPVAALPESKPENLDNDSPRIAALPTLQDKPKFRKFGAVKKSKSDEDDKDNEDDDEDEDEDEDDCEDDDDEDEDDDAEEEAKEPTNG